MDFSRFDNVLAPVIILSPQLSFLYANRVAKGSFPFLASEKSLSRYFLPEELEGISRDLLHGQPIRRTSASASVGAFLFDPVLRVDRGVEYVYLYVEQNYFGQSLPVLSESRLAELLCKEVFDPVCRLLRLVRSLKNSPSVMTDEQATFSLNRIENGLVRIAAKLSAAEASVLPGRQSFSLCNADKILSRCCAQFPPMEYAGGVPCYVSLDAQSFLGIVVDILSSLYQRQGNRGKISVSVKSENAETRLLFRSEAVADAATDLMESPSSEIGVFSVYRRISCAGGRLTFSLKSGRLCAEACFPVPVGHLSILRDPCLGEDTFLMRLYFEYLSILSSCDAE